LPVYENSRILLESSIALYKGNAGYAVLIPALRQFGREVVDGDKY